MPNHVHGIIELTNDDDITVGAKNFSPLPTVQNQTFTSRTIVSIVIGLKIGVTKHLGYSIWQRNYYEYIIGNEQSYQTISNYIIHNPVNWTEDKFYIG
jgi:REP element-mobilizing transposase RayT